MLARIPIRWRIFLFHMLTMLAIGAVLVVGLFAVFGIAVSETVEQLATSRANEAARIIESTGELSDAALATLNRDSVVIIARGIVSSRRLPRLMGHWRSGVVGVSMNRMCFAV